MTAVIERPDAKRVVSELRARAKALGFDAFGIAAANARPDLPDKLSAALAAGWQDGMDWMAETASRRARPDRLWPEVRSVIMVGLNYAPDANPMDRLARRTTGYISVYARGRDYHELIKGRLKELAGLVARRTGAEVKVFVDTAPVMEKPLAEAAGLGWQGKHTVLVSREFGSWLFLGAIFTSAELPYDEPHAESCGTCTKCMDFCPTDAFPAPFRLDARRCIAYLTVEHHGPIPHEFRTAIGNRIFGCDDCLAVCPWNKFAAASREAKFAARHDLPLSALARLDDAGFRRLFAGSPVKRLGHARFLRNVLIAVGNSGNPGLLASAEAHLHHDDPVVRGAAVWAVRRLDPGHAPESDPDPMVRAEWTAAIR